MSLGTYGGTMRGGNTDSTVVVADGAIGSPPIVSRGWSAIVVHPRFFEPLRAKLRADGVVVFDVGIAGDDFDAGETRAFGVDAGSMARSVDAPQAGSLVLLGAYCSLTGMVALDSLVHAMKAAVPPYRHQHLEANGRAIAAGYEGLPHASAPAWAAA
jgi:Pyruvate/2-oxoacid:ferredoxin oxidoreductase gamma subunit